MKLVLKVAALGAAALLLLGLAAALALDPLVGTAVERGTSRATGTPTHLADVEVGWLSGQIELTGLELQNPPGFRDQPFLTVAVARVDAGPAELLGDVVDVPLVELDGLVLHIERGAGGTNYDAILEHLGRAAGAGGEGASSGDRASLRVERMVVNDGTAHVHLDLGLAETSLTVPLPRVELAGVEPSGSGEADLARLTAGLVRGLLEALATSGGLPADLAGQLRGDLSSVDALLGR